MFPDVMNTCSLPCCKAATRKSCWKYFIFALVHMLHTFTIKKQILQQKKVSFCFSCIGAPVWLAVLYLYILPLLKRCFLAESLAYMMAHLQNVSNSTLFLKSRGFGIRIVTNSQLTLAASAFWLWTNLAAELIDSILVTLDVLEWSAEECSGLLFLTDARCTMHQFSTEEVTCVGKLGAETK